MALHFVVDAAAVARVGEEIVLRGAEAHHAATVRRVRPGEQITLGDGQGAWLSAQCVSVAPKEVVAQITAREEIAPASPRVVLVQALAKGGRDEQAVQAATELGVDEIVPWQAERSVSRWEGPKREKGRERWQTIVREAAKQAHRAWIPRVVEAVTTAGVEERAGASRLLVLDPTATTRLSTLTFDASDERDIVLVVGPEGGIADGELERLSAAGATRVALGETVLRTSTAGPAALAVVSTRLGRW